MKKLLVYIYLLFLVSSTCYSSDRALKTTTRTAFLGACGAGLGFGLKKALNYYLANHSSDIPSIITPTTESRFLLIGLGSLGAYIVGEKIRYDKTTPFDNILPIADESLKRRTGKALTLVTGTITAYTILTMAAKQAPADAVFCTAFGLGVIACIEPDK